MSLKIGAFILLAIPVNLDNTRQTLPSTTGTGLFTAYGNLTLTSADGSPIKISGTIADIAHLGLLRQSEELKVSGSGVSVDNLTNAQNSQMLIRVLGYNEMLSDSELEYIDTIIEDCQAVVNDNEFHYIKDFKLAFEYVFKDNQLVDILMTRYQYWEFDEIEVPLYTKQRMIDLGISEEKIRSVYPD